MQRRLDAGAGGDVCAEAVEAAYAALTAALPWVGDAVGQLLPPATTPEEADAWAAAAAADEPWLAVTRLLPELITGISKRCRMSAFLGAGPELLASIVEIAVTVAAPAADFALQVVVNWTRDAGQKPNNAFFAAAPALSALMSERVKPPRTMSVVAARALAALRRALGGDAAAQRGATGILLSVLSAAANAQLAAGMDPMRVFAPLSTKLLRYMLDVAPEPSDELAAFFTKQVLGYDPTRQKRPSCIALLSHHLGDAAAHRIRRSWVSNASRAEGSNANSRALMGVVDARRLHAAGVSMAPVDALVVSAAARRAAATAWQSGATALAAGYALAALCSGESVDDLRVSNAVRFARERASHGTILMEQLRTALAGTRVRVLAPLRASTLNSMRPDAMAPVRACHAVAVYELAASLGVKPEQLVRQLFIFALTCLPWPSSDPRNAFIRRATCISRWRSSRRRPRSAASSAS